MADDERDIHRELAVAGQKLPGAVERIDEPVPTRSHVAWHRALRRTLRRAPAGLGSEGPQTREDGTPCARRSAWVTGEASDFAASRSRSDPYTSRWPASPAMRAIRTTVRRAGRAASLAELVTRGRPDQEGAAGVDPVIFYRGGLLSRSRGDGSGREPSPRRDRGPPSKASGARRNTSGSGNLATERAWGEIEEQTQLPWQLRGSSSPQSREISPGPWRVTGSKDSKSSAPTWRAR